MSSGGMSGRDDRPPMNTGRWGPPRPPRSPRPPRPPRPPQQAYWDEAYGDDANEPDWVVPSYGVPTTPTDISMLSTGPLPTVKLPTRRLQDLSQWDTSVLPQIAEWPSSMLPTLPRARTPDLAASPILVEAGDVPTWVLPVVTAGQATLETTGRRSAVVAGAEGYLALLVNLVKSSGVYALAALGSPLISLGLAPFLAHYLSRTDYGVLTILNTVVGLAAGVTQLGLISAFFRAYSVDFAKSRDRRGVPITTLVLLCLVSFPLAIGAAFMAPALSMILFQTTVYAGSVKLAVYVVLAQNLTVPGLAWPRATEKPLYYSVLSIGSSLVTLVGNIVLVGFFREGINGALIATGAGYVTVALITVPVILIWSGLRFRMDIARSLISFGAPLVLPFISFWVLQLSDRYLLSLFRSIGETASYGVAYTLGSAINVAVITPFTLAWPSTMYMIAKRKDAAQIFRLVFRWLSVLLMFVAYALSLAAQFVLERLFPVAYHSAAPVIPVVAESFVFYGVYIVLVAGANILRKTWINVIFTTVAAIVNLGLNLYLIPVYGQIGAAYSTLVAYIAMAIVAYFVVQRMYPIPFEIGRFTVALAGGVAIFIWSNSVIAVLGPQWNAQIELVGLATYGIWLLLVGTTGRLTQLPARIWLTLRRA